MNQLDNVAEGIKFFIEQFWKIFGIEITEDLKKQIRIGLILLVCVLIILLLINLGMKHKIGRKILKCIEKILKAFK